jgi:hypothetical protein
MTDQIDAPKIETPEDKKAKKYAEHNARVQNAKDEVARLAKEEAAFMDGMKPQQIDLLKKATDKSKVEGVSYTDLAETDRTISKTVDGKEVQVKKKVDAPIPTQPPWTTWSGFMVLRPTSSLKERFVEKCGAIAIKADGTPVEGNENAYAFAGFWTAPENWFNIADEANAAREARKALEKAKAAKAS